MDRRERWAEPVEALRAALDGRQAEMWTALPGIVQSFDPAAMTVSVQPAVAGRISDEAGKAASVDLPILPDVPVVFPGGGVDPADDGARCSWIGPDEEVWARRMGTSADVARRVVTAAARELFEECGVLLAGDERGVCSLDASEPAWAEERRRLVSHETSLADVLKRHGLALRADLLGLRSHWLTPEFEPRRYDTYFFAALAPTGQEPDSRTSEADRAGWVDPQAMFDRAAQGLVRLVPPTAYNLAHLLHAPGVESFAAGVEETGRVMLEPAVREGGRAVLTCRLP